MLLYMMDLESGITRWRAPLPQPSTETDQPANESGGSRNKVLDPGLRKWNKYIAGIQVISLLLVDPLFLYIFVFDSNKKCLDVDYNLTIFFCTIRSVFDMFYFYDVILKFKHHSKFYCLFAIWISLPIPQVVLLLARSAPVVSDYVLMAFSSQFTARLFKLGMYYVELTRHSSLLPKNPAHGAAVNLLLCMLASNVLGAVWYLLMMSDVATCWYKACAEHHCDHLTLNCAVRRTEDYSFLDSSCPLLQPDEIKRPSNFNFGMYHEAIQSGLLENKNRTCRLFYSFWWGLQNLSSLGQNIKTGNSIGQIIFAISIFIIGLFLISLVIHSIQNYAKSILTTDKKRQALRRERNKIEQWMSSHMLPEHLRHRIREYEQCRAQETRSVEEDALIKNLPKDLRRDVTHHLCGDILINVLMFAKMDKWLMNALCYHLEPVLFTEDTYICREGEPVDKMLFLTRGNVLSTSTNGGRRTCVSIDLSKGYYLGEKLIPWALDPNSCPTLPASTTTIQSVKDVEGFTLKAGDLKFLANQFRRLNIEKVQHILRFHSESWRRWSARIIQAAWRHNRWKKRDNSARFIQAAWRLNRLKSLRENGGRQQVAVGTLSH